MFSQNDHNLAHFEEYFALEKMEKKEIDELIGDLRKKGFLIQKGNCFYIDTGKYHKEILSLIDRSRRGIDSLQDIDKKSGLGKENIIEFHCFDFKILFERILDYIAAIDYQLFFIKDPIHIEILLSKQANALEILKEIFDHRLYLKTQMTEVIKKNIKDGKNGRQAGIHRKLYFDPEPLS